MPPSADPADEPIELIATMRAILAAADESEAVRNALSRLFPQLFSGRMRNGTVTSIGSNYYLFFQLDTVQKLLNTVAPKDDLFMIGLQTGNLSTGTYASLVADNEKIEGILGIEPDEILLAPTSRRTKTPSTPPTSQEITGAARYIQLSEDQDDEEIDGNEAT